MYIYIYLCHLLIYIYISDDIPNIWKNKIHVPNHQPDR